MLSEERKEMILRKIVEKGVMKVDELVILTNSSESTIRRDLSNLEKTGQIRRIHGGAVLNKKPIKQIVEKEQPRDKETQKDKEREKEIEKAREKAKEKESEQARQKELARAMEIEKALELEIKKEKQKEEERKKEEEKQRVKEEEKAKAKAKLEGDRSIYKFAASLIEDGDTIYLDADKSIYEMTKFIDKKNIYIVTNGIDNVGKLLEKGIDVYILGGKVKAKTKAVIGASAFNELEKFRFDKAFISIDGIDKEFGLTTSNQEEAMIKTKAIEVAKETFVLADSSKFDKISFAKVSDLIGVTVITDKENKHYRKVLNLKLVD